MSPKLLYILSLCIIIIFFFFADIELDPMIILLVNHQTNEGNRVLRNFKENVDYIHYFSLI